MWTSMNNAGTHTRRPANAATAARRSNACQSPVAIRDQRLELSSWTPIANATVSQNVTRYPTPS
jgi:hypothetical protein